MATILICGDRNWTDRARIMEEVKTLYPTDTVVHGACRGADLLAGDCALSLGLTVRSFPANWAQHGKAAGPIRNQLMLDVTNPDQVWAFHDNLRASRGTQDMINRTTKAGVACTVFSHAR